MSKDIACRVPATRGAWPAIGRRRVGALWLAAALAIGWSETAPGGARAETPDAASSDQYSRSTLSLDLSQTARLARYGLEADSEQLLARFDPQSRTLLRRALGAGDTDLRRQVIAGAVQVRHEVGVTGQTLWFNPVFDAGLLLVWRRVGPSWTVTDARWVLGREIREETSQKAPLPIGAAARPILAQETLYAEQALRRAIAADWRPPPADLNAAAEVADRVKASQASVEAFRAAPGQAGAAWTARSILSLSGPQTSGLRPGLKRELATLTPLARLSFRWVAAYRGGDADWTLVAQTPFSPGEAWFVGFARPRAQGPAEVANVTRIVFAQPEPAR
jgi:hypothetical protein